MRAVTITARLWFSAGNTYHTTCIYLNGQPVRITPIEYGYGEQYLQTALEWVEEFCFGFSGASNLVLEVMNNPDVELYTEVVEVPRKRDLHAGGKGFSFPLHDISVVKS